MNKDILAKKSVHRLPGSIRLIQLNHRINVKNKQSLFNLEN